MKKKFLIALFVVVMACALAFTVSAANEVTTADGNSADLEVVFKVNGNTVNGFNDGWSMANVKDVIFPENITVIKNLNFNNSTVIETVTFESSTELVLESVSFNTSSVKTATFNPECVLNFKSGNFYNCASLTEITFPKFLYLPGNCFQFSKNMVPTNEIVFVEGIETISCHIFNGCGKVWGTVVIPSTVKTIKEGSFNGTGITAFDFSKCVNLTSIGGGYGGSFANIDTIKSYDFSACVNLTKFDGPALFEGSAILESVIMPPNVTSIPHKTFAHCYMMSSLVLPASVTTIADESFHSARSGQEVKTFTMYIQSDVVLNSRYVFRDSGAKIEFVLFGDGITAEQFKTTNAGIDIVQSGKHSPLDDIEVIDYCGGENPWSFVPGQERASHVIVDNYCATLVLTGEHVMGNNPCVILCTDCGISTPKENPEHNIVVLVEYANGYDNPGVKLTKCTNEGCPHKVSEEAGALFVCLGYSVSQYSNGITIGYVVKKDMVTAYESVTDKTVNYGVFAVKKDTLGDNAIIDGNGDYANGVLGFKISNKAFDAFELKVTGFADDQKDTLLAIGAYVEVTDGEAAEYSYMQGDEPSEGQSYHYVSYNSVSYGN